MMSMSTQQPQQQLDGAAGSPSKQQQVASRSGHNSTNSHNMKEASTTASSPSKSAASEGGGNKIPPRYQAAAPNSGATGATSNSSAYYRFGSPDTRASYSERRLMSVRPTSHNHPSHHSQNGGWNGGDKSPSSGRLASLSRSNGSLATATLSDPLDPNGNHRNKLQQPARSRTQTSLEAAANGNKTPAAAPATPNSNSGKRRDFGSHGSLDALTSGAERESFFALLRDLGAQSSSSSSNGSSHVASRSSPERDVDNKPVGCAPSRLAELLRPNFNRGVVTNLQGTGADSLMSTVTIGGSVSLTVVQQQQQQQQNVMTRRSTPEPLVNSSVSSSSHHHQSRSTTLPADSCSPKPRSKFQRFWERDRSKEKSCNPPAGAACPTAAGSSSSQSGSSANSTSRSSSEPSIFKRLRGGGSSAATHKASAVNGTSASPEPDAAERDASDMEARLDERLKRKAFAHHDCQSMSVNLGYAARLRGLLAQRRNTTTGASAASMASSSTSSCANTATVNGTGPSKSNNCKIKSQRSFPPASNASPTDGVPAAAEPETDAGDGKTNHLLLSCPFFRNELGGELEWCVGLSRSSSPQLQTAHHPPPHLLHRPVSTYGVSVLEFPSGKTHWRHGICPYQKQPSVLERGDQGAYYYGNHFYGQEHQNWFGMDEQLGPLAISFRREKMAHDENETGGGHLQSAKDQFAYRVIIRTSELATLRGCILEEAIPSLKPPGLKGLPLRDVLDMVAPEVQLTCLRLAIPGSTTEQQLLKLDQQGLSNHYKVGILYCKASQSTEEEMYNNEEGGPAFEEFLDLIGQRVRLRGFEKYKAGLDNKMDSTGLYSVYSQYQGCEIMFHVSTLLPFTPNNRQQLLRKRHIGNDIVTIVFQEPGAAPFTPKNIRSQFQHVFIIIRVVNPCTDHTQYQIAVTRSKEVPVFGPPIPAGATFPKSKSFVDFLLAKIINAEHAAHRSEKFATMATRTRQEYLKDLATNYVTATNLDSGSKFPILTFSSRKKERLKPRFLPDGIQRGAMCWQVLVDDFSGGGGTVRQTECLLGMSADSLVLVEESTKECIWAVSCKAILGWTSATSSIRLYYHQGECITVHVRDCEADEIPEIVARLHAVTNGCGTRELSLRRNAVGQLGFHVQPDGLVTEVEPHGPAWQASLRQGSRLVEICKVTVATLSHEQMVDLLKTSAVVTVTVLPPVSPDTPRRGCTLQSCSYIAGSIDGEYDNVNSDAQTDSGCHISDGEPATSVRPGAAQQHSAASAHNRRFRYERSVSPPRSSSSSGYGTGSSSRSFSQGPGAILGVVKDSTATRFPANPEGTLTSTSSGHSSDDPWYDFMPELGDPTDILNATIKEVESSSSAKSSPPPLPSRQGPFADRRLRSGHSCEIFGSGTNPKMSVASQNAVPNGRTSVGAPAASSGDHLKSSRSHDQIFHSAPDSPVKKPNVVTTYSTPPVKTKPMMESPTLVGRSNGGGGNYEDLRRVQASSTGSSAGPQEPSKLAETAGKSRPPNPPDYHHAMQSRLVALKSASLPPEHIVRAARQSQSPSLASRSEDELSAGSGNSLSPRSRRRHQNSSAGTLTPSSGSSRNHSPRLLVEAKLKSGAGAGNGGSCSSSSSGKNSQRNCSSNLQEELLRLISPDDDVQDKGSVILTRARPAAVLGNTSQSEMSDLTDSDDLDWTSLVSAAARAIQGAATTMATAQEEDEDAEEDDDEVAEPEGEEEEDEEVPTHDEVESQDSLTSWIDDVTEKLRMEAEAAILSQGKVPQPGELDDQVQVRMNQLEQHVGSLENRLRSEEDRRQALEAEIRRLRDDNMRLQGESQTAAQQLKRFTDWFFQTIERP